LQTFNLFCASNVGWLASNSFLSLFDNRIISAGVIGAEMPALGPTQRPWWRFKKAYIFVSPQLLIARVP
jgi:hypothetical protein